MVPTRTRASEPPPSCVGPVCAHRRHRYPRGSVAELNTSGEALPKGTPGGAEDHHLPKLESSW